MKNFFTFSIVVLILLIVFWVSYNLVFKDGDSEDLARESSEGGILSLLGSGDGDSDVVQKIISSSAMDSIIDSSGKRIIFYDKVKETFKLSNFDGSQEKELTDKLLPKPENIFWASNAKAAILETSEGFYLYNIESREINKTKDNADNVVWANLSNKILYKYFDSETGERTLNIANPDGSSWKKIADVKHRNISIAPIPQTSLVSYWNYPDVNSSSELRSVSIMGEDEKVIMSGKFGADYLWSPDGSKMLMSFVSNGGKNLNLAVANSDGQEYVDLKVPTIVSKCVWSNDSNNVFCALPSNIESEIVLPNDYYSGKFLSKDTFWKINVKNGRKERIVEVEDINDIYDASDLLLSPREDLLFFINRYDENVYRIGL